MFAALLRATVYLDFGKLSVQRLFLLPFAMYALRRHRRPLLFPPGLLALGFLLLLGCGVVSQQAGQRRNFRVLQLTMPALVPDSLDLRLDSQKYMPPAELERYRPWQTITLTSNTWQDYFSLRQAQAVAQALHTDPAHDRGLRIRFAERATYASLVRSIDCFQVTGIRKYWLDMRQEPTTLYTFTSKPRPIPIEVEQGWECGGVLLLKYDVPPSAPALTPSEQLLAFWSALLAPGTWAPLFHPEWRTSLYLLLFLSVLSFSRLFRQWRRG